jgi:hypothetical protein
MAGECLRGVPRCQDMHALITGDVIGDANYYHHELIGMRRPMLEEKLKEAIVGELKRQAANSPRSLQVDDSKELIVKGKIDIDELVMVIAGAMAGGP